MFNIYHNPRCQKSRAGLQFLKESGIEFQVINYLEQPFTAIELKELIHKTGLKPFDLVRTQEEVYKTQFKGLKLTDNEWIETLIKHPKLLKRPIVVNNEKAIWADPADQIEKIID
jgi:arsenate reductase (glutaredoxin)